MKYLFSLLLTSLCVSIYSADQNTNPLIFTLAQSFDNKNLGKTGICFDYAAKKITPIAPKDISCEHPFNILTQYKNISPNHFRIMIQNLSLSNPAPLFFTMTITGAKQIEIKKNIDTDFFEIKNSNKQLTRIIPFALFAKTVLKKTNRTREVTFISHNKAVVDFLNAGCDRAVLSLAKDLRESATRNSDKFHRENPL